MIQTRISIEEAQNAAVQYIVNLLDPDKDDRWQYRINACELMDIHKILCYVVRLKLSRKSFRRDEYDWFGLIQIDAETGEAIGMRRIGPN